MEGADCLSNGGIGGRIGAVAVEGRLESVGILGGDVDGEGVGTVDGGGGGAEGGPLIGGALAAEEGDLFIGNGGAVGGEGAGEGE